MNYYGLFFSYGNRVIRLPINPEELPVTLSGDNAEYNVLGIGDVTVPRVPKQKTVEISSYFPARIDSTVLTPAGFMEPEQYIDFFQKALEEKRILTYTPVRYMENGAQFYASDAGFKCTVESFEILEKGGETGDFYYTLAIKEYRDYTPKIVTTIPSAETVEETMVVATADRSVPATEIVVGSIVTASGDYFYTSYGDDPHGTASGRKCVVSRIMANRPYPYHIQTESGGALGWCKGEALQPTGEVTKVKTAPKAVWYTNDELWASGSDTRYKKGSL